MIEKLPERSGNILGFRIWGKLTEADYLDLLIPEMEKAMKQYPKIRVIWVMEDFKGWTVGGAWEDFLLGMKFSVFEKMAMVIDESWDEWITLLFRAFTTLTGTELRFFKKERLAEAWEWIQA
jgi:SpoIIAA-like